jgi:hypothetical protein
VPGDPSTLMPAGLIHAAITCATDAAGQTNCSGVNGGFLAGLIFVYLAIVVVGIIASVKVVTKAGYSGWWVLITFVPLVGLVFLLIFAFSDWPVLKEVAMLRSQQGGGYYGGPAGYGRPDGYAQPGAYGPTAGYAPPGAYGPPPGLAGRAPTAPAPGSSDPGGSPPEPADLPTFGQFLERGPTPSTPEAVSPGAAPLPPAGWFPAPGGAAGQLRYWDGSGWTDHFSP